MSVARLQMRFDIWRYPFGGVAAENAQRGQRVTHQTGQVLTPTAAPDGDQIAYLSDSGGHANIWVMSTQGPAAADHIRRRSRGGDRRPDLVAGRTMDCLRVVQGKRGFAFGVWLVRPDGSELHQLVPKGLGVAWSPDGDEIYYVETRIESDEEDRGERWRTGDRPIGARAKHDRRAWNRRCISSWSARSWTGGRSSRFARHRSATVRARHQDDRCVARRLLAGPVQSRAVTRRQVAGDAAHRRSDHQYLGAVDGRRPMAAGDGFRRSCGFHRATCLAGRPTAGRSSRPSAKGMPTSCCSRT